MRVLLTRPVEDSARTAREWRTLGAECLVWPLTRIVPLTETVVVPAGTQGLLFTSANAVRVFAGLSQERELPVLAVGDRTAEAAREAGFIAVRSAGGDAADLARLARETALARLMHPRGRDAACDLADALAPAGIDVLAPVLYVAEPAGPPDAASARALAGGAVDVVTIWSPRNAVILRDWIAAAVPTLAGTDLLAISRNAAAPLAGAGFRRVAVAERPDGAAMTAWISAALRK